MLINHQPAPQRILVVKLADLGDALTITPALVALRAALPTATIHVLTTPAGERALADLPIHDGLLVFPKHLFDRPQAMLDPRKLVLGLRLAAQLAQGRYDAVVLLHHLSTFFGTLKYRALLGATRADRRLGLDNGRGSFLRERVLDHGFGVLHESDYWLRVVSLLGADMQAGHLVGPADQRLPLPPTNRVRIAIHPGSGAFAPARRWPLVRWAALADALVADGVQIVLVGGSEEAELRAQLRRQMRYGDALIDWGGQTTVAELGGILQRCALFLGGDSGVLHLAAAVGTPVIAPYGPTDPRAWGPWSGAGWQPIADLGRGVVLLQSGPHHVLQAPLACSPCIYRGSELGRPQGCPDRTCLDRIAVEQVLHVVRTRLTQERHAA